MTTEIRRAAIVLGLLGVALAVGAFAIGKATAGDSGAKRSSGVERVDVSRRAVEVPRLAATRALPALRVERDGGSTSTTTGTAGTDTDGTAGTDTGGTTPYTPPAETSPSTTPADTTPTTTPDSTNEVGE